MPQVLGKKPSETKDLRELLEKVLQRKQNQQQQQQNNKTTFTKISTRIQSSRAVWDDLDLAFA